MRIELEAHGDVQIAREILRFGEHAQDARPAFRKMGQVLEFAEQRQFDTQGGYASAGWAPLKPETVDAKVRKGQDPRILRATDTLRQSLTSGGGDARRVYLRHELSFGTDVPYAKFHQHGTGRMPQRRPLELRRSTREQLVKILQRWIVKGEASK